MFVLIHKIKNFKFIHYKTLFYIEHKNMEFSFYHNIIAVIERYIREKVLFHSE